MLNGIKVFFFSLSLSPSRNEENLFHYKVYNRKIINQIEIYQIFFPIYTHFKIMSKVLPVFGVDSMEREMIDEGCAMCWGKKSKILPSFTNPVDSV